MLNLLHDVNGLMVTSVCSGEDVLDSETLETLGAIPPSVQEGTKNCPIAEPSRDCAVSEFVNQPSSAATQPTGKILAAAC